uniref:Uncharacterized protein n=1 Tax=Gasterosteus aculeatus aculeatus TaxID=481459 RepID=A0AAQ4PE82_GASAC
MSTCSDRPCVEKKNSLFICLDPPHHSLSSLPPLYPCKGQRRWDGSLETHNRVCEINSTHTVVAGLRCS